VAAGGAGTICGLANVLPTVLRAFLDAADDAAAAPALAVIEAVDDLLSADAFLPTCKAAIGIVSGNDTWRRVLPPLLPLGDQANAHLARSLADLATRLGRPID
jgi:4-hydroxy-tetrahydrodipicolinate synthase